MILIHVGVLLHIITVGWKIHHGGIIFSNIHTVRVMCRVAEIVIPNIYKASVCVAAFAQHSPFNFASSFSSSLAFISFSV